MSFLKKQLTTEVVQNNHNAWNKRRAQMSPTYYSPDEFPALPNSKAARTETSEHPSSTNATENDDMSETILVDFKTEMEKERDRLGK